MKTIKPTVRKESFAIIAIGVIASLLIILWTLLLLPIILLDFVVTELRSYLEFRKFLKIYRGARFFCYKSRRNSKPFIEEFVLPALDPEVHIIYLEGQSPVSNLDRRLVSQILRHMGGPSNLPGLARFADGRMVVVSLHDELYQTLNQARNPATTFSGILQRKTSELEAIE